MRLKTYLATYLLFLFVLFSCLGTVSGYMTKAGIDMYAEKCEAEYRTIAASLAKDIVEIREDGYLGGDIDALVDGYIAYYRRHNIIIELTRIPFSEQESENDAGMEISFSDGEGEQIIHISGTLPVASVSLKLDYYYNNTGNVSDMRRIQHILLIICVVFSIIGAFGLYFIMSIIFKPLNVVSNASKKIANGNYSERIHIKGSNELSAMASDFNQMAGKIERQIRALEEETAGKQRFIDNLAHEMRTPLTSIFGYAEYMQKALLDENEIADSAQSIMDQARNMDKIAASLLELATLRNYQPIKSAVSVQRLFRDVSQTLKKILDENRIKLVLANDADFLQGQEDLVRNLLVNLCSNAIKACAPDTGVISIEAKKEGDGVRLSVTDNGRGIPEESIALVTEPFYRVDKARSRKQGGTGLGLAICGQIAEAHGTRMVIESLAGVGTTVFVIFTTP